MTEENVVEEQVSEAASEHEADSYEDEQQEAQTVPLAALMAEKKKRQEAIARAEQAEALAADLRRNSEQQTPEEDEDDDAYVERRQLKENSQLTKREILEMVFQENNPTAVHEINEYLKPILEKKPWLAQSVDTALNRYSRAYEIVKDYKHLVTSNTTNPSSQPDGKRIVENAKKPRSPAETGKSAQLSGVEYLKSIQGTPAFKEYRQKMRQGKA